MTFLEALPKNEEGNIIVPVGGMIDGEPVEGETSEDFLKLAFGDYVNKEVHLSESDYQALLTLSKGNWILNWRIFREQGII